MGKKNEKLAKDVKKALKRFDKALVKGIRKPRPPYVPPKSLRDLEYRD